VTSDEGGGGGRVRGRSFVTVASDEAAAAAGRMRGIEEKKKSFGLAQVGGTTKTRLSILLTTISSRYLIIYDKMC